MTAAEAVVGGMLAHGIDTIYALPGVQNDLLFEALFKAGDAMRGPHPARTGRGLYGAGGGPRDRQTLGLCGGAGAGAVQFVGRPPHRLFDNAPVLALIGEIPDADIGRHLGHLHEIRDQAGIIERLVDIRR